MSKPMPNLTASVLADIADGDEALTLPAAAARLPQLRRNGKAPHSTSLWRWATHGVSGGIRLEVARIGGSYITTARAVTRWLEKLAPRPE